MSECPVLSLFTGRGCQLEAGHLPYGPDRFHRYRQPSSLTRAELDERNRRQYVSNIKCGRAPATCETGAGRFMRKIAIEPSGCWRWTDAPKDTGYGTISLRRRIVYAHRFSYESFVGPIPDGLVIDHLCRNRRCVNPAHLEPVTNRENIYIRSVGFFAPYVRGECQRGHPLTTENVYVRPKGGARMCKPCQRMRTRARSQVAA